MARQHTTLIPDSQCIGDSLVTINTNSLNLDESVQALSARDITVTDSSTIDLVYDSNTRNLTASIKLSSIDTAYITSNFTLSASQISTESIPTTFKKFRFNLGDNTTSTYYRGNFFISQDNSLYAAGYGAGYHFGQGSEGMNYAVGGWRKLMIPLLEGEVVEEVYTAGLGSPTMYVLTNFKNVYGTGYNTYGQLGIGNTTTQQLWVKVPIENVEYFTASQSNNDTTHCFAINSSGELWGWGYNAYGNLGLGNTANQYSPQRVNTGDMAGKTIKKCFASAGYNRSFIIDTDDLVYSAGYNGYGQLGINNVTNQNRFVSIYNQASLPADYIILTSSSSSSSYLIRNNEIWSCGYNGYGQLGLGDTTQRNIFEKINGISVKQMAVSRAGESSVIALQLDGTIRTWGYNGYGQLGTNNTTSQNTPTIPFGNPQNVIKVASHDVTYAHTTFLNADGELWSCGYNGHGQLGVGDTTQRNVFTKVVKNGNLKFKDFDLGGYSSGSFMTAVDQNGELWACGYHLQHSLATPYTQTSVTVLQKTVIID